MSVSPATALHFGHQLASIANRSRTSQDQTAASSSSASTSSKDSVSLSENVKSAYKAQASLASQALPAESTARAPGATPEEIRDFSSQMRRLSSEATQNRNAEPTQITADASGQDSSMAAPLSDTLTADEGAHPSFTPLAEAPQTMNPESNGGNNGDAQPRYQQDSSESTATDAGAAVDSQASLVNLDHALGKITHGRRLHGSDFESLSQATRLSVKQRESLAVAHSEGGSLELASATSQAGRTSASRKQPTGAPSQSASASATRGSNTYTRPARKA